MPVDPSIAGLALVGAAPLGYYEAGIQPVNVSIDNYGATAGEVTVELLGKGPLTGHHPALLSSIADPARRLLPERLSNNVPSRTPISFDADLNLTTRAAIVYIETRCAPANPGRVYEDHLYVTVKVSR